MSIYGYARISRPTQKIERQIQNIIREYPNAIIKQEAYTGTKIEGRKEFKKLLDIVKAGDTIVFDSVSRMSRNADEGVKTYFELFEKGVKLIFLKEHYIDTEIYKNNSKDKIDGYVIIDDLGGEWLRPCSSHLLQTSEYKGLQEKHIKVAERILNMEV